MLKKIAGQYRYLVAECQLLSEQLDDLDYEYTGDNPESLRLIAEIRDLLEKRIVRYLSECNQFEEWLRAVPDRFTRSIIAMRYIGGMSWAEIAAQTCNSPDAVKKIAYRQFEREVKNSA